MAIDVIFEVRDEVSTQSSKYSIYLGGSSFLCVYLTIAACILRYRGQCTSFNHQSTIRPLSFKMLVASPSSSGTYSLYNQHRSDPVTNFNISFLMVIFFQCQWASYLLKLTSPKILCKIYLCCHLFFHTEERYDQVMQGTDMSHSRLLILNQEHDSSISS